MQRFTFGHGGRQLELDHLDPKLLSGNLIQKQRVNYIESPSSARKNTFTLDKSADESDSDLSDDSF